MRAKGLFILVTLLVFVLSSQTWSSNQSPDLSSGERDALRKAVIDELNKRRGAFTSPQEDTANWKFTEEEKSREDDAYRENVDKARLSFIGAKNMRDDLAAQVRSLSTDSDDTLQQIKTIRTTIENIDNSLIRWNQDLKTHHKSFETGLSTEKQGSVLVAVMYTVDAKDTQNVLDGIADRTSAALLAERKGTYMQSFTKALGDVLSEDFVRSMTDGAFVGRREKALLIALATDNRGTTYLRLKRYDFYPFQKPKSSQLQTQGDSPALPAVVVDSPRDLEAFLKKANFSLSNKDLSEASGLIRDTEGGNIQAEERLNEQIRSFREKKRQPSKED